ncbi:reverse transcriptase [Gossypium australe]|uniref:Reverse transcriptase n=1 Tax=Gossypium australe TaxID=47621 RepID=A0A5B6VBC7_9ROSI|nr:reverse transcriptase [Gossypium australe]
MLLVQGSANVSHEDIVGFCHAFGVHSIEILERCLCLPSIVGRNKRMAFKGLKEKCFNRLNSWGSKNLSISGWEILIKSVLQVIPMYAMSCFLLPRSFCSELEALMARFWWQKSGGRKGIHWCSWQMLCDLKEDGGIGFKDLAKFNIALLAKQRLLPSWLKWRIGSGQMISIWNDYLLLGTEVVKVHRRGFQLLTGYVTYFFQIRIVGIRSIFSEDETNAILGISLPKNVLMD